MRCLRRAPHPTHAHLDAVLGWARELKVGRLILTHLDNSMDHAQLSAELPDWAAPQAADWPWIAAIGTGSFTAHYCMTRAMKLADAAAGTPDPARAAEPVPSARSST